MHYLHSFLNLILALFFILIGIITLLLPWSETIRNTFVTFINENAWPWNLFGLGFILIGSGIGAYTALTKRKQYFSIKLGPCETSISEKVIDDYLRTYFTKQFPSQDIPYRFTLSKNTFHLTVDLPFVPIEDQKELLSKMEEDLQGIFREFIGYRKKLNFSFSFAKHTAQR
jgi:hypothetical protein